MISPSPKVEYVIISWRICSRFCGVPPLFDPGFTILVSCLNQSKHRLGFLVVDCYRGRNPPQQNGSWSGFFQLDFIVASFNTHHLERKLLVMKVKIRKQTSSQERGICMFALVCKRSGSSSYHYFWGGLYFSAQISRCHQHHNSWSVQNSAIHLGTEHGHMQQNVAITIIP